VYMNVHLLSLRGEDGGFKRTQTRTLSKRAARACVTHQC
jgi:hypothetical protein